MGSKKSHGSFRLQVSGLAIQHDDANPECHLHKIEVTLSNLEH